MKDRFQGQDQRLRDIAGEVTENELPEALARALVENAPDALVVTNEGGQICLVNAQTERLFGYGREELIGCSLEVLLPERFRSSHPKHRRDYSEDPHVRSLGTQGEFFGCAKDGREFPVDVRLGPLQTAESLLVIAYIRDISEHKRIEESLKQSERFSKKLLAEIVHQNRVESIGALTAAIAHDTNQSLAANLSYAQAALRFLMADPPDLDGAREALRGAVVSNKRTAAVVNRLRSLVKNEEIRRRRVDINASLREVANFLTSEILLRNARVNLDLTPGNPEVHVDRILIQQVIMNLVVNALDTLGDQAPHTRHISISSKLDGAGQVAVSVADSGPGIDPDRLEDLFDPFVTTKPGGLGLGLSTSRRIAEAHGAQLRAKNGADGGAIFTLTLPVCSSEE